MDGRPLRSSQVAGPRQRGEETSQSDCETTFSCWPIWWQQQWSCGAGYTSQTLDDIIRPTSTDRVTLSSFLRHYPWLAYCCFGQRELLMALPASTCNIRTPRLSVGPLDDDCIFFFFFFLGFCTRPVPFNLMIYIDPRRPRNQRPISAERVES